MKRHFILRFYGLETLQPYRTSEDTVLLRKWCLINNVTILTSTVKKSPQNTSLYDVQQKISSPVQSRDYGWAHKQVASGTSGFRHEVGENCALLGC